MNSRLKVLYEFGAIWSDFRLKLASPHRLSDKILVLYSVRRLYLKQGSGQAVTVIN